MSGLRMIWIMTVEGLLNTDWLGLLGVLAPPIISAWVAYQIARYQIDTQLKKQNDLDVKKDKRMLATQIRLAKYEEFQLALTEYIDLHYQEYTIVSRSYIYSQDHPKTKQFKSQIDDLDTKLKIVYNKINVLSPFCTDFEKPWTVLYFSYAHLDQFIFDNIKKNTEQDLSEQTNVELTESELADLDTEAYNSYKAYYFKLQVIYDDFYPKGRDLTKLVNDSIFKIMSELEKDL